MNRLLFPGALLIVAVAAGCGGPKIASVSGTVTLDGKAYKDAIVSFQPQGGSDNPEPGRGSAGVTDENGRYTLTYDGSRPGAVVGKHRVRIFTKLGDEPSRDDGAEEAPKVKAQRFAEPIPMEWHEKSEKEFVVPADGTDKADFAIETKPGKK